MHKSPTGHRFIIASKVCNTKRVSKSVSSAFKLIFGQVESFHRKAKFNSHYAKFGVLQNVDPVIDILKKLTNGTMLNQFLLMILALCTLRSRIVT